MEPTDALDRTVGAAAAGGTQPHNSGLLVEVKLLWRELRALAHDQWMLAALEARLAGKSLVTMIATGVMVAALLVSAWYRTAVANPHRGSSDHRDAACRRRQAGARRRDL